MIFNGGPSGNTSSGIDFNFGGKFNLETDIQISFDNETYQNLKFYSNETTVEKEYYELRYQNEEDPDTNKWYIKFLDNCYIQLSKKLKCDLFMVGKGQDGGNGVANANVTSDNGPAGGSGGKIFEELNKELSASTYNIIIKNDNTQIKTYTDNQILYSSSNGNIYFSSGENNDSNGGAGAIVTTTGGVNSTGGKPADSGEDGIKKYGIYYGAGGGGGGCSRYYVTGINPDIPEDDVHHYDYNAQSQPGAVGGGENSSNSYSGGCGANSSTQRNALPNTGSGGGGGYSGTNSKSNGGTGSYGTIIISSL